MTRAQARAAAAYLEWEAELRDEEDGEFALEDIIPDADERRELVLEYFEYCEIDPEEDDDFAIMPDHGILRWIAESLNDYDG